MSRRAANDFEAKGRLIEHDQTIDVVGAKGEMVDAHETAESTSPLRPLFIDACAHLDEAEFDSDREDVMERSASDGVVRFVVAGFTEDSFARAKAIRDERVRVGIGLHPWAIESSSAEQRERWLRALETDDADFIGEIGLDAVAAKREGATLEAQIEAFRAALSIGRELGKPMLLHVVHAHPQAQAIVRALLPLPRLVVHGFVGGPGVAREWLKLGACLSFGTALLRSPRTLATAAALPRGRCLFESDAPHGQSRSERGTPSSVVAIAEAVAREAGRPLHELAAESFETTSRIFF